MPIGQIRWWFCSKTVLAGREACLQPPVKLHLTNLILLLTYFPTCVQLSHPGRQRDLIMTCVRSVRHSFIRGGASPVPDARLTHFSSAAYPFNLQPSTFDCPASPLFLALPYISGVSPSSTAFTYLTGGWGHGFNLRRFSRGTSHQSQLTCFLPLAPSYPSLCSKIHPRFLCFQ
jgi:hypothetical protein